MIERTKEEAGLVTVPASFDPGPLLMETKLQSQKDPPGSAGCSLSVWTATPASLFWESIGSHSVPAKTSLRSIHLLLLLHVVVTFQLASNTLEQLMHI